MHALHEHGLRVPADVAVVGFDDIDDGKYSTPTLSTIAPDKTAIAQTALDLLMDRIDDVARTPKQVVVPHSLEVRGSSARPADTLGPANGVLCSTVGRTQHCLLIR